MWQPVADGLLAERARDHARAIGDALAADPRWLSTTPATLYGGPAGVALLFAYLDEVFGGYADECARWLDRAIDQVAGGLPLVDMVGIARAVEHLASADANRDVDVALAEALAGSFDPHFDLLSGLVGLGCYALERQSPCLVDIVERLECWAVRRDAGLVWWTPPELLPPYQREVHPGGHVDLGLAHGQPGVVALLARVAVLPEFAERTRPLLDGAVRTLLAHGAHGFAYYAVESAPRARAAWCYGDPGVATALLATGDAEARALALRLAHETAAWSPAEAGAVDAGLCHGTAGLMLMFQRIANATGDTRLRDRARDWLGHTLALARRGEGIGGYLAHRNDRFEPRAGLLSGAAGTALALLAAATELEPAWDRMLLLS